MLFGRKDRKPIKIVEKPVKEWKYTTCGYCSTGCSIEVGIDEDGKAVGTRGDTGADVNRGKLCIKGIFEHQLFDSEGRGGQPLMRDKFYQDFKPASGTKRSIRRPLNSSESRKSTAKILSLSSRLGRSSLKNFILWVNWCEVVLVPIIMMVIRRFAWLLPFQAISALLVLTDLLVVMRTLSIRSA